jgi:predicted CXXCH cytochrome family protein
MKISLRWLPALAAAVILGMGAAGCVDTETVYIERPQWENPPEGAAGFLGYSREESKLTTCGNCHIGQQARWKESAHAGAWSGLVASGHAQSFCEGCHTVSDLGNRAEGAVAWSATKDSRYKDVQCESCHGPGLAHVQLPDAEANKPIASLAVGKELKDGCGQCHSGAHHPYMEEWSGSKHGKVIASAANRAECAECHSGQGALKAWGIKGNYVEKNSPQHLAFTCGVCHDPHEATHDGQLRFAADVASVTQNLCMKCHHKRGEPDLSAAQRGPHSPEGPMLLGQAGWVPPNMTYDPGLIVGTHGSERNKRLCAGCHMQQHTVADATGGFVKNVTGHSFEAIPCVDANGAPRPGPCAVTERSFRSCTSAGCHGSEAVARSIMLVAQQRLKTLADELDRLLAQVPASEFNHLDNIYTTAEGARFNSQLARRPGSAIHNPFLAEWLVTASIQQVRTQYGVMVSPSINLELELGAQ